MERNPTGCQQIDLDEKIRRMKAHANRRSKKDRKAGAWVLVFIGLVAISIIVAGWDRQRAASASAAKNELRTP